MIRWSSVMRKSREATAQSKANIVSAAAKMVRERGVESTGIADVMEAAGMTNGGFYRHFESKNQMIGAAIKASFDEITDRFSRRLRSNGPSAAVRAYVEEYLSERHLEHPGHGCPVAAVATDASRLRGALSTEFAEGAERLIRHLANGTNGNPGSAAKRKKAIRHLAMLVGAVVISRAVGQGALRKEVIDACSGNESL
jgi:TetR/AcrR family transcriptional regulator, transcriptional repressor for nem operon